MEMEKKKKKVRETMWEILKHVMSVKYDYDKCGEKYDYDFITNKVNNFRKKIHLKDIEIYCVTLPIKDKNDFIKRVEEVIVEYE